MNTYLLIKYLHFLGIFAVVGSLTTELFLVKPELTRSEIRRLGLVDGVYGLGAILVVAAGLLLWLEVGKPAEFYSRNWIFHLKFSLFVVIGVLSIWPTVFFIKNRKGEESETVQMPRWMIRIVYAEVAILLIMPLLAVLMANGIGQF